MSHRSSIHSPLTFVVLAAVLGTAILSAQAGKVSGTIVVGKTKITPQAVSAVGYKAPNGELISVLISDKAANQKEFLERTKVGPGEPLVSAIFEGAWKGLHLEKALSGFSFTLNGKRLMTTEFLVGGNDAFSMFEDDFVLELTSTSPRLTGRIRTKEPVMEVGTQKVSLDVTFDVPVGQPGK